MNFLGTNFWKGDSTIAKLWGFIGYKRKVEKIFVVLWKRPPDNWHKLNSVGSSKGNLGALTMGGIIRDSHGALFLAYASYLGDNMNMFAELSAVVEKLQHCFKRGLTQVWIEIDTAYLIPMLQKQVVGEWQQQ
ncbi:hypothetical protein Pfo_018159 [Paulownia fortunei]|nr:hypothetical protein Pfo_018159 [Paulownia fortunei]